MHIISISLLLIVYSVTTQAVQIPSLPTWSSYQYLDSLGVQKQATQPTDNLRLLLKLEHGLFKGIKTKNIVNRFEG